MEVKIKKEHPEAKVPEYQSEGAACFDLVAVTEKVKSGVTGPTVEYDCGLSFEIPKGHVGLVFPRSSITAKTTFMLGNGVGVIDSDYRGTIKFEFRNVNPAFGKKYNVGDRVGQMMIFPIPMCQLVEVDKLSSTERGTGGYGSTGN